MSSVGVCHDEWRAAVLRVAALEKTEQPETAKAEVVQFLMDAGATMKCGGDSVASKFTHDVSHQAGSLFVAVAGRQVEFKWAPKSPAGVTTLAHLGKAPDKEGEECAVCGDFKKGNAKQHLLGRGSRAGCLSKRGGDGWRAALARATEEKATQARAPGALPVANPIPPVLGGRTGPQIARGHADRGPALTVLRVDFAYDAYLSKPDIQDAIQEAILATLRQLGITASVVSSAAGSVLLWCRGDEAQMRRCMPAFLCAVDAGDVRQVGGYNLIAVGWCGSGHFVWHSKARGDVLARVKQRGKALRLASKELRGDREVVLAAVGRDVYALEFATDELKGDRDFVLTAVRQHG